MKRVGITQRVEHIVSYGERRDCLDQRWSELAMHLELIPVPLPNIMPEAVPDLLDSLELDCFILSGGNSLSSLEPQAKDAAPERDAFEESLLTCARERKIPCLGICRGMQMINYYFGGKMVPCRGHVATRHSLLVEKDYEHLLPTEVNSFHGYSLPSTELAKVLRPIAVDLEGHIEAFEHLSEKITGIMWHPEREKTFHAQDLLLLKKALEL